MVQKRIFFPSPKMKDCQTMCASLPSLLPQAGLLAHACTPISVSKPITSHLEISESYKKDLKHQEDSIKKKKLWDIVFGSSQFLFVIMFRTSPTQYRLFLSVFLRIPHSVTRDGERAISRL